MKKAYKIYLNAFTFGALKANNQGYFNSAASIQFPTEIICKNRLITFVII